VTRAGLAGAAVAVWAVLWLARPATAPRGAAARPASPPTGIAPLTAGASTFCPGGMYSGYAPTRQFVPPNYPADAPSSAPDRCYESAAEAIRAGLRSAPLPTGDALVEGIYLVPSHPTLERSCRVAARALGFAVPCPRLLPNPSFGTTPPECGTYGAITAPNGNSGNPACVVDVGFEYVEPFQAPPRMRAFLLQEGGFAAPPEYEAIPGGNPTAAITVIGAPRAIWIQVADATVGCDDRTELEAGRVGDAAATISGCPSSFGGVAQTILSWERAGVVYAIVAVGGPDQNDALLEAIAAHVRFIEPS